MNPKFLLQKRIDAGLSQSQIADALGYSIQTISLYESNKGTPNLAIWSKYASLLKIDLEGFLFDKDKKDNAYCELYSFDSKRFASNLRKLRKSKNITQYALAKEIGSNPSSIIRYEKGESFPSLNQFISLSNYYHVDIDELYFALSLKKETKEVSKKKKIILPIILPIVITVAVGGATTGIVLGVTSNNKRNINGGPNNGYITDSSSGSNTSSGGTEEVIERETMTFGIYPQSHISDESLIDVLKTLSPNSVGYYLYGGHYYYKSVAQKSIYGDGAAYHFDDGIQIVNGETYWYSCDPIEWMVFKNEDGKKLLFASKVLDCSSYSTSGLNNYKDSNVRAYINNDFYNKAFIAGETPLTTEVDNSPTSTGFENNPYACENTLDKVFLPSAKELFYPDFYDHPELCEITKRYSTDFARASGADASVNFGSAYLTRSPCNRNEDSLMIVTNGGAVFSGTVDQVKAICPMITIND